MNNKIICLFLSAGLIAGCANKHWIQGNPQDGTIFLKDAPPFPGFCFDGLVRKWQDAGCSTINYEVISSGYVKYWCASPSTEEIKNILYTNDFFAITWNSQTGSYARGIPVNTTPLCGDEATILVTAERD